MRQQLAEVYRLRKEPKAKLIIRAEDEFKCLRTLWASPEIILDLELHRLCLALIVQLAGVTGNRPKALLTLRYKHVGVALLPDPRGKELPRVLIKWKFEQTKGYLSQKDANTIPVPDIPNEKCLILCPYITLFALAFHRKAFTAPDLIPVGLYNLKVLPGQGQQLLPWKENVENDYLFPKAVRTALQIELSDDYLPYKFLRQKLAKIGEVTGISLPVGAYCFRRGNGEALDSSSHISDAQRNLCLQHGPNSTVFQRNYLSRHITADTQAAFRGLEPQTEIMRVATGLSRTIDTRRPTYLTPTQQDEAHQHPQVQQLLQKKLELKAELKSDGRTIKSHEGTAVYVEYQNLKQAYESEYSFQKISLLKKIKQHYNKEQPVIDIQNQIHNIALPDEEGGSKPSSWPELIPERVAAVCALFTFVPCSPQSEREHCAQVIDALVTLSGVQNGHHFPVRRHRRKLPSPRANPEPALSLSCKPTQCFICLGNSKAPPDQRTRQFYSRADLKKHLLRFHIKRHKGNWPLRCPIDGELLIHDMHVLNHADLVHKTPLLVR